LFSFFYFTLITLSNVCLLHIFYVPHLATFIFKFLFYVIAFTIAYIHLVQCFPKSDPRTIFGLQDYLFWSARKKTTILIQNKMKGWVLEFKFFSCIFIKVSFNPTKFIFMARRAIFYNIMVRPNIFQCFMVLKLEKFGKH
jgi:hypothetical protein